MRRAGVLGYGVIAYFAFAAIFAALLDFLAQTGFVRAIDAGPTASTATALAINLALLATFGITHSVLARAPVTRALTRIIPTAAERSTYVLVASATLALLIWQWRAMPDIIWHIDAPAARAIFWAIHVAAIALVAYATLLTNHFDLFGLRQVWLYWRGVPYTPVPFVERSLYKRVRHPMMLGFLVWLWATPTMTVGHLAFAGGMTVYIAIGVYFEERALIAELGRTYESYRRRVPAIFPRL